MSRFFVRSVSRMHLGMVRVTNCDEKTLYRELDSVPYPSGRIDGACPSGKYLPSRAWVLDCDDRRCRQAETIQPP